jgi:hypothetical protein
LSGEDNIRVRVWYGWKDNYPKEPNEVVEVETETPTLWEDDPYARTKIAFDVHPDDCPATLFVHTNDSVRSPPGYEGHLEKGYWGDAVERGLEFSGRYNPGEDPFGVELFGRIMFWVEEGYKR